MRRRRPACLIKKVQPLLGDVAADIVLGYHVHASSCGAGSAWYSPVQLFRLMVHLVGRDRAMPRPVRKDDQDPLGLVPTSNHTPEPNTQDPRVCAASLRSLLRPWM